MEKEAKDIVKNRRRNKRNGERYEIEVDVVKKKK